MTINKLSKTRIWHKLLSGLLLIFLLFTFTACSGKITKLSLSNMMLYSTNELGQLIQSSTFTPQTEEIMVRFDLAAPEYPVDIVGRLFYIDATDDKDKDEDYLVVDGSLLADYAGLHSISITRPVKGWPQGNYKIELYKKDDYKKPLLVANFIVL